MTSKLVTYDLATPNGDYTSLHTKLQTYPHWVKVTQSCWLIKSSDPSSKICSDLESVLNNDDRLFVAEIAEDVAWVLPHMDTIALKLVLHAKN